MLAPEYVDVVLDAVEELQPAMDRLTPTAWRVLATCAVHGRAERLAVLTQVIVCAVSHDRGPLLRVVLQRLTAATATSAAHLRNQDRHLAIEAVLAAVTASALRDLMTTDDYNLLCAPMTRAHRIGQPARRPL